MNVAKIKQYLPHLKYPFVVAGPCSAESEEQVLQTAREIAKIPYVTAFRAGIWKPRTRPAHFEGVGVKGLPWMQRVKEETGLLTAIEVATADHVEAALRHGIDIVWIGARTSANPFSVQEIAEALSGSGRIVMIKNPVNADLSLWIGAIERVLACGLNKVIAIHRGFSSYTKTKYRNPPRWQIPIELKRLHPELPMICDPSHIAGLRDKIFEVSQRAHDIDMDGLMIETHIDPSMALSDAEQQVTPSSLYKILKDIQLRKPLVKDKQFDVGLDELRRQIDQIDMELLESLSLRMNVVEKITDLKMKHNVTALQMRRWEDILQKRQSLGSQLHLREAYIHDLFELIHQESVSYQTKKMAQANKHDSQKD